MTTFEMAWKRTTAVIATLIAVLLIIAGATVTVIQFLKTDPVEQTPVTGTLKFWDDPEMGIRCYTFGDNLRCYAGLTPVLEEESEDDSFPEDEWFRRAAERGRLAGASL